MAMATHTAGGADGDGTSPVCPGAQMFSPTYAQSLDMRALQGPRLLEIDLLGDGADDIPADSGSPLSDATSPMSRAPSPCMATSAAQNSPPSVSECAAPLQDSYAKLWLSTDPADLRGLLNEGASVMSSSADTDESEPDDHHTDTDAAAASCPMGEEHVLAIIEHIISTCTPVAEAHSLLSILQGAGTVPWKTLEPYVKVLRQWQSECGRHAVQSRDVGTPRAVEAAPINHEGTAKFHALHHVVLWTFAVGGWNVCSAAGMEAKHKEVRIAALRVNDRDNTQYDTGRQVCALIHELAIQIQSMIA